MGHTKQHQLTLLTLENGYSYGVGDTVEFDRMVRTGKRNEPIEGVKMRATAVVCAVVAETWEGSERPDWVNRYYLETVTATGTELRAWLHRDNVEVVKRGSARPANGPHDGTYGDTGGPMRKGDLDALQGKAAELLRANTGGAYRDVDVFRTIESIRAQLAEVERAYAQTMRENGASWQDVADAAGAKSKQAAQQRLGGVK